jgi:hypothetical protein
VSKRPQDRKLPPSALQSAGLRLNLQVQKRADSKSNERLLRHIGNLKDSGGLSEASSEPEGASPARLLIDPMVRYQFKMTSTANISSNVAGVINGYVSFDPTGLGGSEWTYLSGLFDYVRLVEARLTLIAINPHSDGYATGRINAFVPFSCDAGRTATAPGSIAAVIDCANLVCVSPAEPKPQIIRYKAPSDLNWATTLAPVPGAYAGCYGQFQFYQTGLSVSLQYISYVYEGIYEFCSRT